MSATTESETRQPNKEYAEKNERFRQACEKAGVSPTKRQAAKYRRGEGKAFRAT